MATGITIIGLAASDWYGIYIGNEIFLTYQVFVGSDFASIPARSAGNSNTTPGGRQIFSTNDDVVRIGRTSTNEVLFSSNDPGVDPMPLRVVKLPW